MNLSKLLRYTAERYSEALRQCQAEGAENRKECIRAKLADEHFQPPHFSSQPDRQVDDKSAA